MFLVEYFYINGLIPETFRGIIPEYCDCGHPMLLSENMKQLSCSNPSCPYHMSQKMNSMFKQLNVKDIGPSTCREIIEENELVHHTQVFYLKVDDMPSKNKYPIKEKFYNEIHKVNALPLNKIAQLLRAPNMQGRCEDIFKGYSDINKFYTDFNYSEDFIAERLNMSKGITTRTFTDNLTMLEHFLRGLCTKFKILSVVESEITVCMHGDVMTARRPDGSAYPNRKIFIEEMQDLARNVLNIINKNSISSKVNYLITDSPNDGQRKNQYVDNYNANRAYNSPPIVKLTFEQFQQAIFNMINEEGGITNE